MQPWGHAELYGVMGSRGVMDQGSTLGPQGTPTPSQEEIHKYTPTPPHIPHSDPKLLPTCPHTPYVPMPPPVPAPTGPTFTSHVAFSCAALCSCRLCAHILPCAYIPLSPPTRTQSPIAAPGPSQTRYTSPTANLGPHRVPVSPAAPLILALGSH